VSVLWAGHIREDDARDGPRRLEASDVPVGAGGAIVLPDSGQWRYVDAAVLSGGVSRADGLLFGYDSTLEGFVVPTTDDVDPAVYIAGVGARRVSRPGLAARRRTLAAGGARALWRAADAGQTALDDDARRDEQSFGHAGDTQTLTVVWTGRLPGRRHGAVVSEGRGPGMSLALAFGEVPKNENSAGKQDEGSELLGFGSSRLGRRADAGEAVGGAYVQLGELPYLAVAGTGVKEITAIVGRHTLSRSALFALIPATPLEPRSGKATDTVVYGRDKYGAVIAPLPPPH
jgi:hypothetical protein